MDGVEQMGDLDDALIWGLVLVLIGDILILWVELARRRKEERRMDSLFINRV